MSEFATRALGEIASCRMGETILSRELNSTGYPIYSADSSTKPWGYKNELHKVLERGSIVIGARGTIGKPRLPNYDKFGCTQTTIAVIPGEDVNPFYLKSVLEISNIAKIAAQQAVPMLTVGDINQLSIPLPSLPEQKKIAEILSGIDNQIEHFQKSTSSIELLWTGVLKSLLKGAEMIASKQALGSIVEVINGRAYKLSEWEDYGTPVVRLQNLTQRGGSFYYSNLQLPDKQYCNKGDLLFMWSASFGPYIWWGEKAIFHYHIWKMIPKSDLLSKDYLYLLLQDKTQEWKSQGSGMAMIHLTKEGIEKESIPLPPISEQQRIVATMKSIEIHRAATKQKMEKLLFLKDALLSDLLSGRKRVSI